MVSVMVMNGEENDGVGLRRVFMLLYRIKCTACRVLQPFMFCFTAVSHAHVAMSIVHSGLVKGRIRTQVLAEMTVPTDIELVN